MLRTFQNTASDAVWTSGATQRPWHGRLDLYLAHKIGH